MKIDAIVPFWITLSARPSQGHRWHEAAMRPTHFPLQPTTSSLLTSLKMPGCWSTIICHPVVRRLSRCGLGRDSQHSLFLIRSPIRESIEPTKNTPHSPIYTLNDDVLLNLFYLYQLNVTDGNWSVEWRRQRWWYKLAQVCRQWRYLILASPSYLDLHLLCTYGVPVADMLAHSPPLPLTIYYDEPYRGMSAEDEEAVLLALSHRDRVRCIFLDFPASTLRKLITVMDGQFPILERLYVLRWPVATIPVFPGTFQAPNLRHLRLWTAPPLIGSPLLTTTAGLVTLRLIQIPTSAHFPPDYLLTQLSIMLQLEDLVINFKSPLSNRDLQRQLSRTPNMTQVTLPNLREFWFRGTTAYLEGLAAQISTPVLSVLQVEVFNQLTFTVPRLLQFMNTSENFVLTALWLHYLMDGLVLRTEYLGDSIYTPLLLKLRYLDFDWQESSAAQIFSGIQPVLSAVEQLTLMSEDHYLSSEWHDGVDRTQWRELIRPFSNVQTLHVQDELIDRVSHSLQSDDGEPSLELLPNLKELGHSGGGNARDAFTPFIDERQASGQSVSLTMVDHSVFQEVRWQDREFMHHSGVRPQISRYFYHMYPSC
jgi:hypothetical protein